MKYLILFFVVLLLQACPEKPDVPFDSFIKINNEANKDLVYCLYERSIGDTLLSEGQPFPSDFSSRFVSANSLHIEKGHFIYGLRSKKNKYYLVFLFSKDTVLKYKWSNIRDNYRIEKKFCIVADSFKGKDSVTLIYP